MSSDPELVGSLIGVALGFAFILYGYSRCFGPKYLTNSIGMSAPTEQVLSSKKTEKSGNKHPPTSVASVKPSKHVDEFAAWVNPVSTKDDNQSSATFKTTYSTAFLALPGREPCEHSRCFATLKGHRSYITSIAFSASGKYIVTCSEDCTTRVWRDVASNSASPPFHTINNGTEFATAACFIQDKYLVLATDETSKLQYYDISKNAQGSLSFQLKFEISHGHDAPVKYLTIAPGTWKFGFTCARGNNDTQLRIISAKGELKHAIKTNQLINHQAKLSHNGQIIGVATKMADCKIHFIDYDASGDFKALQPMCQLRDHKNGVFDVSFTVDGKFAVTGGGDGKWRVFQLPIRWKDGEEAKCIAVHETPFDVVEFVEVHPMPNSDLVAIACENIIRLHKISTGQLVDTIPFAHKGRITCMQFSPDGKFLATGSSDKTTRLWNMM